MEWWIFGMQACRDLILNNILYQVKVWCHECLLVVPIWRRRKKIYLMAHFLNFFLEYSLGIGVKGTIKLLSWVLASRWDSCIQNKALSENCKSLSPNLTLTSTKTVRTEWPKISEICCWLAKRISFLIIWFKNIPIQWRLFLKKKVTGDKFINFTNFHLNKSNKQTLPKPNARDSIWMTSEYTNMAPETQELGMLQTL